MENTREAIVITVKAIVADVVIAMGRLGVQTIASEIRNDDAKCRYDVDVLLGSAVKVTLSVVGQHGYTDAIILDKLTVLYMNVTSAWDGQIQEKLQSILSAIESTAFTYGFDGFGTTTA